MKGLSLEVRVGLLILVSIVLLGGFIFVLGGVELGEGYNVFVDFNNPGNIKPGAPVNVGSIRVGRVEDIEYLGGRLDPQTGRRALIRLKLRIDDEVKDTIHEDSLFYITSQSMLGEAIVAIDPGDPEGPVLAPNTIVEGIDPPRMDLALSLAYEMLETLSKLLRDNKDDIEALLAGAANMIRAMDRILTEHGDRIDHIIENVERATEEASELMASARGTIDSPQVQRSLRNIDRTLATVARDIDPILTDVRSIGTKVDGALDAFGPEQQEEIRQTIANAAELSEAANTTLADAQGIVSHIREGRGTVGALLMDDEIYDDIQEMLRDLKHNPWKLFWRE